MKSWRGSTQGDSGVAARISVGIAHDSRSDRQRSSSSAALTDRTSDVEPDLEHVAVVYDVVLAFETDLAL
jgi:hypothetical protein